MLSKILGVMFKVKQIFTKNYISLAHYAFFSPFEMIRSQSFNASKSYQNYQVTSIKKLLEVLIAFHFIMK